MHILCLLFIGNCSWQIYENKELVDTSFFLFLIEKTNKSFYDLIRKLATRDDNNFTS